MCLNCPAGEEDGLAALSAVRAPGGVPGYDEDGVALLEDELLLSGVFEVALPGPPPVRAVVAVGAVTDDVVDGLSLSVFTGVLLLWWCSVVLVAPFMVAVAPLSLDTAAPRRFPRGLADATAADAALAVSCWW
jgi:hypothetical protein